MSTTQRRRVYYQSKKTREYLASVIDGCLLSSEKISDALLLCEREAELLRESVLLKDTSDIWLHRVIFLKPCKFKAKASRRVKRR